MGDFLDSQRPCPRTLDLEFVTGVAYFYAHSGSYVLIVTIVTIGEWRDYSLGTSGYPKQQFKMPHRNRQYTHAMS